MKRNNGQDLVQDYDDRPGSSEVDLLPNSLVMNDRPDQHTLFNIIMPTSYHWVQVPFEVRFRLANLVLALSQLDVIGTISALNNLGMITNFSASQTSSDHIFRVVSSLFGDW